MKVTIVTIGDEILIGQIVDTNSAWIANELTQTGFEVHDIISIGDDVQQIKETIANASKQVDVILVTGGLGPTKDDITKKTLCEYFGTELIFSDEVLANIQNVISNVFTLNELTRNQAYVPKDCTVIQNTVGTAPITWFEKDDTIVVSMPGVPYEMRNVITNEIIPRLQARFETESYVRQSFIVRGYTESGLALHLTDFENNLPKDFGLAYLPSLGMMKLRLFVKGEHRRTELNKQVKLIEELLGNAILAEDDLSVEKILSLKLAEKRLTLATAESCTGGNIAHLITMIPGSSAIFKGSVVAYSNEIKQNVLGVSASNLEKDGAVSESVVLEMAQGARKLMDVDCAISVSGIAGPDGGTEDKPVGTVWIASSYKDKTIAKHYLMGKFREANIERSSTIAMLQLLEMIE